MYKNTAGKNDLHHLKKRIIEFMSVNKDEVFSIRFIALAFCDYPETMVRFALAELGESGMLTRVSDGMRIAFGHGEDSESTTRNTHPNVPSSDTTLAANGTSPTTSRQNVPPQQQGDKGPLVSTHAPKSWHASARQVPHTDKSVESYIEGCKTYSFYDDMPTTFHKPVAFRINGAIHKVRSWRQLMIDLCAELYKNHPQVFESTAQKREGLPQSTRSRAPFTFDSSHFIRPAQIPGTRIWVESTRNAKSIKALLKDVITQCEVPRDEVLIYLKKADRAGGQTRTGDQAANIAKQSNAQVKEPVNKTKSQRQNAAGNSRQRHCRASDACPISVVGKHSITSNTFSLRFKANATIADEGTVLFVSFFDQKNRQLCKWQTLSIVSGQVFPKLARFRLTTYADGGNTYDLVVRDKRDSDDMSVSIPFYADVPFKTEDFAY